MFFTRDRNIFQSPDTLLPDGPYSDHHPCGKVDDFSYRAIGTPFQGAPLPPSSQLPVSAILDTSLQQRLEGALLDFLGAHDLVEPVYNETSSLLLHMEETRLFCTNSPECTVSVHDLRIRILEPLVTIALKNDHDKIEEDGKKSGGCYLLQYRPEDPLQPQLPRGITFALRHAITGVASNTTISFEEDSSFLTFGRQPNLFAREDECKFFLNEGKPIPLDPCGRSHGAQAMLNKLAWRMQSANQRDPKTGKVEVPVRFGIMMSTHFAILAESVTNPNNDQEVGLVYTPIFKTGNDFEDRDRYAFDFRPTSIPLLFLAIMLDHILKVPPPPEEALNYLFGTGTQLDNSSGGSGVEGQTKLERPEEGGGEQPTGLENKGQGANQPCEPESKGPPEPSAHVVWTTKRIAVQASLNTTLWPPRISLYKFDRGNRVNGSRRFEAVIFEVVSKPGKALKAPRHNPRHDLVHLPPALVYYLSRPLGEIGGRRKSSVVLSDLNEVKVNTLPILAAEQLLGKGGFGFVTAGRLMASTAAIRDVDSKDGSSKALEVGSSPVGSRNEDSTDSRSSSIPTNRPVVIKLFEADQLEAGIRESLFYDHVFPLLPEKASAFLPSYYGTFRSARGHTIALIMDYGGRPIPRSERSNEELRQRVAKVYRLFDKYGIDHSDRELRNVLLRDDGSLCVIDWNLATLKFTSHSRGVKRAKMVPTG